ncbi:site-2 protease family protein [Actinomycetospora straminea]|uniref:site-2 protease family protein n=1 Tax=Actinomycetospora straminea TaxID=663607 RepID=UPI002366CFFE|nr:site-2 protease family protein [Actinomycetospora straminea]MDD7933181.1 site-2 protease family protein [Actinomycetospora straminea]
MSAVTAGHARRHPRPGPGMVPLGRVAGVPVAAHWSVLGIVALLAIVMARSELPLLAPGQGSLAYALAGVSVALLLMASLLAHEVAHALVARASGVGIEGITLWLLGGTTRMRGEPERPGPELRIAAVGPVVSAALAGLFGLVAVLTRPVVADLVHAVLAELALVNIVLAVFNLLPAAPLDGGRVLRAALWARRGDRWAAAITAAHAGRVLAALLVAGGVVLALGAGPGGLWLALIGWFVGVAAVEEERRARQGRALDGITVGEAATAAPVVVAADGSPAALVAAAGTPRAAIAGVLLTDPAGEPAGYVPPARLRLLGGGRDDRRARRPAPVPASRLTTVRPGDALARFLGDLAVPQGRLVVVDDGTVIGTVSRTEVEDLLRHAATSSPGPPATPSDTTPRRVPAPDAPPPPDWWWHGGPRRPRREPGA